VPGCCATFESAALHQFDDARAASELARYRRKGPGPTTRLLEDAVAQSCGSGGTLLDIGAGIGPLTFGLLARGISRAVAVDASAAYLAAARAEAKRIDRADAIEFVHGDFVPLAAKLPAADVVTLDRVVCCYPDYVGLLDAALEHAGRCIGLAYPRDVWYVRTLMRLENGRRRLTGNPFRSFVHPAASIDQLIRTAGFNLSSRRESWFWIVAVYRRRA
jgi:magnesium-protoporphyrin O-methyltransferase